MKPRLLAGILLLVPFVPGTEAGPSPNFYERILATGDVDDYAPANRALDLDTLYLSETFKFDPDELTGVDVVTIRVAPKAFSDLQLCSPKIGNSAQRICGIRYDVYFEAGGRQHQVNATYEWSGGDPPGPEVVWANAPVRANATSVFFSLPREDFGLHPGTLIQRLWATSSLVEEDQTTLHDRIPGDNKNTPAEAHPEFAGLFAPDQRLEGTFEFFQVEAISPLHQRSVRGDDARYDFLIVPSPGVQNDRITVLWDAPLEWAVIPSRGETSGRPTGQLLDVSAGERIEFSFTARARDLVEPGQHYGILMHVISFSGGSHLVPVTLAVTEERYESPDHRFRLESAGPWRAGQPAAIRIAILDAQGVARVDAPVGADFFHEGQLVATAPGTLRDGAWDVTYSFPKAGPWRLDAFLADLEPAPHQTFNVQVEGARNAPGPDLVLAVLAPAGLLAWRRRGP